MYLRIGVFVLYSADGSGLFCVTICILQQCCVLGFFSPTRSIFFLNTCDACFTFQNAAASLVFRVFFS